MIFQKLGLANTDTYIHVCASSPLPRNLYDQFIWVDLIMIRLSVCLPVFESFMYLVSPVGCKSNAPRFPLKLCELSTIALMLDFSSFFREQLILLTFKLQLRLVKMFTVKTLAGENYWLI